jgi:hypothetical protein
MVSEISRCSGGTLSTPQPDTGVQEGGAGTLAVPRPASAIASDEISLTVPGIFALEGPPRTQYELHMTRVAKDVLKEASNLATGTPEGSRKKLTEFHSDHVDQAFRLVADRGLKRKGRPGWYVATRAAQAFCILTTGAAGALMSLPNALPIWGYCFSATFAASSLLIVVLEVADRSQAR